MNLNKIIKNQYTIGIVIGIIIASVVGGLIYGMVSAKEQSSWLPENKITDTAKAFINTNLVQQGEATVKVVGKEGDLYKLEVSYNGQKIDSYITKDGKRLFPQSLEVVTKETDKNDAGSKSNNAVNEVAKKSDKPAVELFVMSHCPYGTQIEKGIIPVVEKLGNKIDFEIKFTDYAMHGEKELKEQLNQYCIQKEQNSKYLGYLECFLKAGEGESCLKQSSIDQSKLSSCVSKTDSEYKVIANFNSKTGYKGNYPGFEIYKSDNEKYGVAGSPTLIINGTQAESGRDSNSLLKTICSSFSNVPEECKSTLSSDTPAPGFGASTGDSQSSGGCAGN